MIPDENSQAATDRFRAPVDAEMRRLLEGRGDSLLYRMIRYHLGHADPEGHPTTSAGGKRVRAALCLLACGAAGGDPEAAAPVGAALELVHAFTLLHDDIADKDETRRGRPTVWKLWGVGQAITAGDAMYALANLAVDNITSAVTPQTAVAVLRDLNQAVLDVCEGQQLDISYEGRMDLDYADYLRMASLKTGALFRAACETGARVAGASDETVRKLSAFGSAVGIAYQIQDDVLGIWGDPETLGKPVGSDLRQNKRSLPVVLVLSSEDPALRVRITARLARGVSTDAEALALATEMEEGGIRERCELVAETLLQGASDEHLREARLPREGETALRNFACYLTERVQ